MRRSPPTASARTRNSCVDTDNAGSRIATSVAAGNSSQTRAAANAEIRSIARIAGLDQSWIDGQIDGGADPDTARRAAFEALAKRSSPAIRTEQVRVEMGESQDEPTLRARQMGEALYARINPRHELSESARRYAYSTPVDMARELLTLRGESTMALSPASLVTRALHTTSDFGVTIDAADAVARGLKPEALRTRILADLAARSDAAGIIATAPAAAATKDSPIIAAAKKAASDVKR